MLLCCRLLTLLLLRPLVRVRSLSADNYDCLRANKAMMAWGVEARVPFLDRHFLEYVMSFDTADKMCVDEDGNPRPGAQKTVFLRHLCTLKSERFPRQARVNIIT
jgi:asparagine synthetase B (glutamine-hydrolysing)